MLNGSLYCPGNLGEKGFCVFTFFFSSVRLILSGLQKSPWKKTQKPWKFSFYFFEHFKLCIIILPRKKAQWKFLVKILLNSGSITFLNWTFGYKICHFSACGTQI